MGVPHSVILLKSCSCSLLKLVLIYTTLFVYPVGSLWLPCQGTPIYSALKSRSGLFSLFARSSLHHVILSCSTSIAQISEHLHLSLHRFSASPRCPYLQARLAYLWPRRGSPLHSARSVSFRLRPCWCMAKQPASSLEPYLRCSPLCL